MALHVDAVVVRAAGVSIFGTMGFAICHVVIMLLGDMGSDSQYVWVNAAFFGALGALGAGKVRARSVDQSFWEHIGLCLGAFIAALVSSPHILTGGIMFTVLVVAGVSSWDRERRRLKQNE